MQFFYGEVYLKKAVMYQVETKRINEQVKRNEKRFRDSFMFQLNQRE
jgi:hypothetical protein